MLVEMSLESLGKTKLAPLFAEAIATTVESLEKDGDVSGKREVTIKLSFEKTETGHITTSLSCSTKTPLRSVKTLAALGDTGTLRIDTATNDARQPSMLPDPEAKEAEATAEAGS